MTTEEITVKLTEHHEEIGSIKHRVSNLEKNAETIQDIRHSAALLDKRASDLEKKTDVIQELAISVNELAVNMKAMLAEQEKQGKKIESLESVPAKKWDTLQTVIITALASGLITYILTRIF